VIILKTREEIERMRASCVIVAEVHEAIRSLVRPGATTMDLEAAAEEETRKRGATPAFKGYRDYPFCLCTSLNNEVVHGMPSDKRVLNDGDLVSIDFGVLYNGYYGDAAVTYPIGTVDPEAARLIDVTRRSLDRAIEATREGNRLMDIGSSVQTYVEAEGFSVVRDFVGHTTAGAELRQVRQGREAQGRDGPCHRAHDKHGRLRCKNPR
jgi:methionyl aminopeptidase